MSVSDAGRRWLAALAAAVLPAVAPPAAAGDVAAGRAKALQCQTCHGLNGIATLPIAPNLAGQTESYLVKALSEYRSGVRKDPMMSVVAAGLSDEDIANLAAYYHSIVITVKTPD
ncbi:MAG: c-type cytochrome [Pseudomonadota bacterium]